MRCIGHAVGITVRCCRTDVACGGVMDVCGGMGGAVGAAHINPTSDGVGET